MKVINNSKGLKVMIPDDVPDSEADKGIPVGIHLSSLLTDYPEPFANELQNEMERRGFTKKEDYDKPGAYKQMSDALRRVLKVTANNIVDKIRRET